MGDGLIYHLCRGEDWRTASVGGAYHPPAAAAEGFIHFSTAGQVAESAARHFAGEADLLLVTVDVGRLGTALKWEASRNGALFPHLYGPLPLMAVMEVEAIVLASDGTHRLPFLAGSVDDA